MTDIKIGDHVVRNPATWRSSYRDGCGVGSGVGRVIPSLWKSMDDPRLKRPTGEFDSFVEVEWSCGRMAHLREELMLAPPPRKILDEVVKTIALVAAGIVVLPLLFVVGPVVFLTVFLRDFTGLMFVKDYEPVMSNDD